jgi:hypothetical protein
MIAETSTMQEDTMATEEMIPLRDAAADLGLAHTTLARQARLARIHGARKVGPIWVVPKTGLDDYRRVSLGRPGRKATVRP